MQFIHLKQAGNFETWGKIKIKKNLKEKQARVKWSESYITKQNELFWSPANVASRFFRVRISTSHFLKDFFTENTPD